MEIKKNKAKKVITKDSNGKTNGYLIELAKKGHKTTCYLTVAHPGCFKGYHLHTLRVSNYTILKGKAKIILYTKNGKEEHILDSENLDTLHIPINIPTAFENLWEEDAWLVNYPNPPYDPTLTDEQVDFTEQEVLDGKHLKYQGF